VLAELGIDTADAFPKPVTDEVLAAADVVVTLGCRDTVPLLPGRRYADWPVADPAAGLADTVRAIRDQIDIHVTGLPAELPTTARTS
jgi:protein-tyrosine-phosphatase